MCKLAKFLIRSFMLLNFMHNILFIANKVILGEIFNNLLLHNNVAIITGKEILDNTMNILTVETTVKSRYYVEAYINGERFLNKNS